MAASREEVYERVKEVLTEQLGVDEERDHRGGVVPGGPRRRLARPRRADHGARGSVRDQDLRRGCAEDHDRRPGSRLRHVAPVSARLAAELIDELPAERAAAVFTHSSWAADRTDSYERLEFLGDSVLELAIARTLYDRFPDFTEGQMAKIRSHVVSRASCAVVAARARARRAAARERTRARGRRRAARRATGTCSRRCSRRRSPRSTSSTASRRSQPAIVEAFEPRIEYALTTSVDHKTELQEQLARTRPARSATRCSRSRGRRTTARSPRPRCIDGEEVGVGTRPVEEGRRAGGGAGGARRRLGPAARRVERRPAALGSLRRACT